MHAFYAGRHRTSRPLVGAAILLALLGAFAVALVGRPLAAHAGVTRTEALTRAERWVDNPVPYSMTAYKDGYRTDCSGFISMAWNADMSYTTQTLDSAATTIGKDQLKPGDALLWKNDTGDRIGHVRLFVSWADAAKSEYWVYEQTPPRTRKAKYRWADTVGTYRPIRFDDIEDAPTSRPASGLDAASWGEGRVDLVARSGQNRLLHRYYSGGAWSAWTQPVNTVIASDPAITSWGPRRLDVFARSDHNELVHIYFNGSAWLAETLPGTITSGPEAVSWGDGRIDVVARGGSNQLVHWSYDRAAGGWAARWDHRGGALSSDPTITSWVPADWTSSPRTTRTASSTSTTPTPPGRTGRCGPRRTHSRPRPTPSPGDLAASTSSCATPTASSATSTTTTEPDRRRPSAPGS